MFLDPNHLTKSRFLATLPDASFDSHVLHSIPLHCLLCSQGSHLRGARGVAGGGRLRPLHWSVWRQV